MLGEVFAPAERPDFLETDDLAAQASAGFEPDPDLRCDEWALQHRVLSPEDSKTAGPWRHDVTPWMRDIMRALSPQVRIQRVVWRSSSQTGKSAIGLNFVGAIMDVAPGPILVVQPTQTTARKFTRQRLNPMIRDSPALRVRVVEGKGREGGNSTFEKQFPGGTLFVGWAGSANELASMPIRYVMADEVSKWERDLDGQGDALGQVEQRTQNFGDSKKIYIPSTPTEVGSCTVTTEFEAGDQRRLEVPCPHCGPGREDGGYQEIVWEQVQWQKDIRDGRKIHRPETAAYVCALCGSVWTEGERLAAIRRYRWVAHNWDGAGERRILTPEDAERSPVGTASFDAWCLYTNWESPASLAKEFLKVRHDPAKLKRFTNLKLGRPWRPDETELDTSVLMNRREDHGGKIPTGVAKLTAGVDVQGDRLEIAVWGWGPDDEAWCVTHLRVYGDPDLDAVWERLEAVRTQVWEHESGAEMRIEAMMIDARHKSERVFKYVRPRQGQGVRALYGYDQRAKELLSQPKRPNKHGVKPVTVATHNLKDTLMPRLARTKPGPGYVHFCQQDPHADGMDANYFEQFKGEVRVRERNNKGRMVAHWKAVADRTEAIDTYVYAYAGLLFMGPMVYEGLERELARVLAAGARRTAAKEEAGEGASRPPVAKKEPKKSRGGRWATMGGALGGGGW